MRSSELEAWAQGVVRQVLSRRRVEDSRIELKSRWPTDPPKAARQIAAHANASRGEHILWIIGVDEDAYTIVGADPDDMATWWNQVRAQFDGEAPQLSHLTFHEGSATLIALYMECLHTPYVVKNPLFGVSKGAMSHEVPWREGTTTRSARHADLIQILVPLARRPSIDVLKAEIACTIEMSGRSAEQPFVTKCKFVLYFVPTQPGRIVVPFHRCQATLRFDRENMDIPLNGIRLSPDRPLYVGSTRFGDTPPPPPKAHSLTIDSTPDELLIDGPGKATLYARCDIPSALELTEMCNVTLVLGIAGDSVPPIGLSIEVPRSDAESTETRIVWRSEMGVDNTG